jgi:hypothetical protein
MGSLEGKSSEREMMMTKRFNTREKKNSTPAVDACQVGWLLLMGVGGHGRLLRASREVLEIQGAFTLLLMSSSLGGWVNGDLMQVTFYNS